MTWDFHIPVETNTLFTSYKMKTPFEDVEDDVDGWCRSLLVVTSLISTCSACFILKDAGWKLPKGGTEIVVLCITVTAAVLMLHSALFGSLTNVDSWANAALTSSHLTATVFLFLLAWPVYYMLRPFWKRKPKREQYVPPNPRSPSARGFGGR